MFRPERWRLIIHYISEASKVLDGGEDLRLGKVLDASSRARTCLESHGTILTFRFRSKVS
jgi:hypothetical protein